MKKYDEADALLGCLMLSHVAQQLVSDKEYIKAEAVGLAILDTVNTLKLGDSLRDTMVKALANIRRKINEQAC